MNEITELVPVDSMTPIAQVEARAHEYIASAVSEATRKARRGD